MPQKKTALKRSTPWKNEGGGLLSRKNSKGERVWAVRIQRRDKTRHLETFGPGQGARLAAERRITELRAARYEHRVPVEYGRFTFGQASEEALPGLLIHVGNKKDKVNKEFRLRKLQTKYGDLRLGEITEAHSIKCKLWLLDEEELKTKTVNAYIDLFKAILDHAVATRKLEANPLKDQPRLKRVDPLETRNPLTPEEWTVVLENTRKGWFRDAIIGLCHSGMRRGELVGLNWEDIDLSKNRIVVRARSAGGGEERKRVKSLAGNRSVPMTLEVKEILVENKKRGTKFPFPGNDDQKRIVISTLGNDWSNLRKRLFEKNIVDIQHKRLHDLRHSFGVWSAIDGVPLTALKVIMGHSSIEQTASYAAVSNEEALTLWQKKSRIGQDSDR
jgi:integrase